MRRKDRQITDRQKIDEILKGGQLMHLAMAVENEPYLVCVNYGYDGKDVYLHCAGQGKKLDMMAANPNVCFKVVADYALTTASEACEYTAEYASVVGRGKAELLTDAKQKRYGLDMVMAQLDKSRTFSYPDAMVKRVGVVKVAVESLDGKACK